MSKAEGRMHKRSECRQESHGGQLAEAQSWDAFTLRVEGRLHDAFDTLLREMTVVTDPLDVEQTSIDISSNLLQVRQVGNVLALLRNPQGC